MTTLTEPIATEQAAAETPAHSCPAEDILRRLGSDKESGLTTTQARENLRRFGPNALAEPPPTPAWRQFLGQFEEPVVWLLLGAGAIAAALHEWADLIAISAIVVLNALLGFFQQRKAEKALSALRRLSAPTAKVVRDGAPSVLPAHELTPGDLVVLEAGDQVPADVRLVGGFGLRVTEASLTGESTPAGKDALAILSPTAPLGDRCNMAYLGTVVATGKASGVVVATGMSTELGRIAGLLR
ncbi:MAG TPA: cation-transporting P-type ATPase, partial [Pirellulales bacterium]